MSENAQPESTQKAKRTIRLKNCPKCDLELKRGMGPECPRCGLIFVKYFKAIERQKQQLKEEADAKSEAAEKKRKALLKNCPACQKEVSINAPSCPHCGEPFSSTKNHSTEKQFVADTKNKPQPEVSKSSARKLIVALLTIILGGAFLMNLMSDESESMTPTEKRAATIKAGFSAWDGSHLELTKKIKESMHDPSSYEHVETRYRDNGDYLFVVTTFRGKNAFGGKVTNTMKANVTIDGTVIEILSQ
jgi:hypothetical protein